MARFYQTGRLISQRFSSSECFIEKLPDAPGISVLYLNRPGSRNALGKSLLAEMNKCLLEISKDREIRALIIASKVPKVFCAGADLKERAGMTAADTGRLVSMLRDTFTKVADLSVPTICSLDGVALGGGLELALAADLRVAGPNAKLGLPELGLGIIPGAGGTQRLPRLVGVAKAKELIFLSKILDSESSFRIGLVNQSSPDSFAACVEMAKLIAVKAPIAVKMAKSSITHGSQVDISSGLKLEEGCYSQVLNTKDRLEGLAAFREKRTPLYKGE